jgi:Cof subfamily protein (haloacid dehalogenase superfamily)
MKKYRALCTDIDGTLLDTRRELSDRTIATIKQINNNVPVILASSRMPSAMRHLQAQLDILDHPLICYNGGYILQYTAGETMPIIFDSVFIPADVCDSILHLARNTEINVSLYFEDNWYAPKVDYWTDREQRITKVNATIADPEIIISQWKQQKIGGHKVMCMGHEAEINAMENQLREKHDNDIHIYRSRPTYLELAPKIISKATALKMLMDRVYNIPMDAVISFGDNYNDIDMLEKSGLGIAVENARDEVKVVAKEISGKSIDDGVAIAIERYFF